MMRGRFLGNKDAAIWSKVQKNFKDQDVMVAVKKALDEPLPASLSTPSSSSPAGASAGMSTSISTSTSTSTSARGAAGDMHNKPSLGLNKKESPFPSPSHGSSPGSRPITPMGAKGMSKGMGMGPGRPALSRAVLSSSSLAISPTSYSSVATGDGITKKPSLVKQKSVVRAVPAESTPMSGHVQEASGSLLFFVVGSIKRRLSVLLSAPFSLPGSSKNAWDSSQIACEDPHSVALEHEASPKHDSPLPSVTPTQDSVRGDSVPVRKADSFTGMLASLITTAPLEKSTARNPGAGAGAGAEGKASSTHSTAHGSKPKSTAQKEPPTVTPSTTPSVTPTDHTQKNSAHTRDKKVPVHAGNEGVTQEGETRVKRMGRILAGMGMA
jgi:hypothetical protein